MIRMKRGKPHKRETQILVGESSKENQIQGRMTYVIDKYLPPRNRYRTWLIKYYYFYLYKRGGYNSEGIRGILKTY